MANKTTANISNKNSAVDWGIDCTKESKLDGECCTEIVFLGDVALAGQVGEVIRQQGSKYLFDKIAPEYFDVDILCFNLECCLSNRGEVWEPKPFPFRGDADFLSVFPQGRCKYVANIANNHFLDYGEDAAVDTLEALQAFGMKNIGATGSAVDGQWQILSTRAGNIGLISFAPSAHSLPNSSLVNLANMCVSDMALRVNMLKKQSDVVIVSLHQGVEHTRCVDRCCREFTHRLVDAGADCILCHHPHIIQGIEEYKGAHVFHSIGSFVIGMDFQQRPSARKSLALKMLLHDKKLHKIIIEPFVITDTLQPRPATGQEKQQIRNEVELLSSVFNSKFRTNVNYTKCGWIKMCDRMASFFEMTRQKGIITTMKYYYGRIRAKTKG